MQTLPSTIQPRLHPRLLEELRRFFGGRRPAFRELFQNAFRAGAKNVTITQDGSTLLFQDDGTGCPDPQVLVSAGETGWNEGLIFQPAGLGFFSLLDPTAFTSVEAQSCAWRVEMKPDDVAKAKPLNVDSGTTHTGMRIQLTLANPEKVREDIQEARDYYPFHVTFNGEEVPVTKWQPEWEFDTPVGRVGLRPRIHYNHNFRAIWDHRGIRGEALEKALERAGEDWLGAKIVGGYRIHWHVDARSGVTPILPNRNDLHASPALDAPWLTKPSSGPQGGSRDEPARPLPE